MLSEALSFEFWSADRAVGGHVVVAVWRKKIEEQVFLFYLVEKIGKVEQKAHCAVSGDVVVAAWHWHQQHIVTLQ